MLVFSDTTPPSCVSSTPVVCFTCYFALQKAASTAQKLIVEPNVRTGQSPEQSCAIRSALTSRRLPNSARL